MLCRVRHLSLQKLAAKIATKPKESMHANAIRNYFQHSRTNDSRSHTPRITCVAETITQPCSLPRQRVSRSLPPPPEGGGRSASHQTLTTTLTHTERKRYVRSKRVSHKVQLENTLSRGGGIQRDVLHEARSGSHAQGHAAHFSTDF